MDDRPPPTPETQPIPEPAAGPPSDQVATSPPRPSPVLAGWPTAVLWAVVTFVGLLVLSGLVLLIPFLSAHPRPSASDLARAGGTLFFAFHHIGFTIEIPRSLFGSGSSLSLIPVDLSGGVVVAFAPVLATIIALLLLARGGRAVANNAGGSTLVRGLHGIKIAVPYALLMFAASFALRFSSSEVIPGSGDRFTIHPSHLAALLWPLVLGAVAGFAGGLRSLRPEEAEPGSWGTRIRAAVAGGWTMIALGLLFVFVGLLVMAAVYPDATRAYFQPFNESTSAGLTVIIFTLLFLPNGTAWILYPAMGSCTGVSGAFHFCVLSYSQFPRTGGAAVNPNNPLGGFALPNPPAGYYLFILAPLLAVIIGGMVATRRGNAATRGEAAGLGAMAGVVFGALSLGLIVLSTINLKIGASTGTLGIGGGVQFGPEFNTGALLALVWGVVGGALGGLIRGRSLPARTVTVAAAPVVGPGAATPPPAEPAPPPPPDASAPPPAEPAPTTELPSASEPRPGPEPEPPVEPVPPPPADPGPG